MQQFVSLLTKLSIVSSCFTLFISTAFSATIEETPQLNGKVVGDIQLLKASSFSLNSTAKIEGTLKLVGNPTVHKNGTVQLGEVEQGEGDIETVYTLTLNNGSELQKLLTHTDPVELPTVVEPAAPTGSKWVNLNSGQDFTEWTTLKSLNLNSNYGDLIVPPGSYEQISVSSGSNIILGIKDSETPVVYNLNRLQLNSQANLILQGPVVINLKSGLNVNNNTTLGTATESLTIHVFNGSINVNNGAKVYASIVAPKSHVNLSGEITGDLIAKNLNLNNTGVLTISDTTATPVVSEESDTETTDDGDETPVTDGEEGEKCLGLVANQININGRVNGSLQLLSAKAFNLNSPAFINGDLYVPASPTVNVNGTPTFTGVEPGEGTATGNAYTIHINNGATLGKLFTETDPFNLTPVAEPNAPQGAQTVTLNQNQPAPNWNAVRSLTLNDNYGNIAVPAGAYDRFTINQNTSITLGDPNAEEPTVYHLNALTVNSEAQVIIAGPVILNIKQGFTTNSKSKMGFSGGDENFPFYINVFSSHVNVNAEAEVIANLNAPNSSVQINGAFTGALIAKNLTVNSQGNLTLACSAIDDQNTAPVAVNQTVITAEDTAKAITLNATDTENDALTYTITQQPTNGALAGTAPSLVYTPNPGFNGADTFKFSVNDGEEDSNVATVTITVTPVNDLPVASNLAITTPEDTPKAILLVGSDPDGDAITYSLVTQPTKGTITGNAPSITYTPTANFSGQDSFTYKVNDGNADSSVATVTVVVTPVNDAPIANAQNLTLPEDSSLAIILTGSDTDGDTISYIITSQPTNGILTGEGENRTYTPAPNFFGEDKFTFKVNDGTVDSPVVEVKLTVTPINDIPTAANVSATTNEITPVEITLLGADQDPGELTYSIVTTSSNATLTVDANTATYSPALGFVGVDTFTYKVTDSAGAESTVATATVTVVDVNNPPFTFDLNLTTPEDVPIAVGLAGFDPDQDPITFELVNTTINGTLTGEVPNLIYTPNPNFNGVDTLSYKVNDGELDSIVQTLTITVNPVNDAPVAEDQELEIEEDTALTITLGATDIDLDNLHYEIIQIPLHGSLSIPATFSSENPELSYVPESDYVGIDTFKFKVSDESGGEDEGVITITVGEIPVNQAPVVNLGEDVVIPIVIERGSNLLVDNEGGFDVADWAQSGSWINYSLENSTEVSVIGDLAFKPSNTGDASLTQSFDIDDMSLVDLGTQLFSFSVFTKSENNASTTDQATLRVLFYDELDNVLEEYSGVAPEQSASWTLLAVGDYIPVGSRRMEVILEAEYGLFDNDNDVLFTSPELYVYENKPHAITAVVTDDGLPDDTLTSDWSVSGENITSLPNNSFELALYPQQPGSHRVELQVSDGELSASDEVLITFTEGRNGVPVVNAGEDTSIDFDAQTYTLNGIVTDDSPVEELVVSWSFVEGPIIPEFSEPTSVSSGVSFREPGKYVLRLTAFDGLHIVSDDIEIDVTCSGEGEMDLVIVVDHSGSMGQIFNVYSKIYTARRALVTLLEKPNYDNVRVSLGTLSLINLPLTNDVNQILSTSENGFSGGSSFTDDGIDKAVTELLTNGRSGVRKVIIALADGQASQGYTGSNRARENGIRVLTLGFGTGVNESYLQQLATLPSDYRFIAGTEDVDGVFEGLARSICLNEAPTVIAGSPVIVQNPDELITLRGKFVDDGIPSNVEKQISWVQISGPTEAKFADSSSLQTTVSLPEVGEYVIELRVDDGEKVGVDTITLAHESLDCYKPLLSTAVRWWTFNSSINDVVANEDFTRVSNVDFSEGLTGKALSIDSVYSSVIIPAAETLAGHSNSLEFWFKYDQAGIILLTGANREGAIRISGTSLLVNNSTIATGLTDEEWYHLVITQASNDLSDVYLNSVKVAENVFVGQLDNPIYIGGLPFSSTGARMTVEDFVRYRGVISPTYIENSYQHQGCGYRYVDSNVNLPPYVDAGKYQRLVLPENEVVLEGEASDDKVILSTKWTQISGPTIAEISNPNSLRSIVKGLETGTYVFELMARDNEFVTKSQTEVVVSDKLCKFHIYDTAKYWSFNGHIDEYYEGNQDLGENLNSTAVFEGVESNLYLDIKSSESFIVDNNFLSEELGVNESFSIEFWIKYDGQNGRVLSWDGGAYISIDETKISLIYKDVNGNRVLYHLHGDYTDGEWHHIVININKQETHGFLDGQFSDSRYWNIDFDAFSNRLRLGHYVQFNSFVGSIDELIVYNRNLTYQDVLRKYNSSNLDWNVYEENKLLIDAGRDASMFSLNESLELRGSAFSDNGVKGIKWEKLSGAGNVTFSSPNLLTTSVSADAEGIYVLQLSVNDGRCEAFDTVELRVLDTCSISVVDGITHWWSFNGHTHDLIGDADGQWFGLPSYQDGYSHQSFNGQNTKDVIEIKSSNGEANPMEEIHEAPFSIEYWVKYDGTNSRVMEWLDNGSNDNYIIQNSINSTFGYQYIESDEIYRSSTLSLRHAFNQGEWYHISYAYDGSVLRGYVNGKEKSSVIRRLSHLGFKGNLFIGGLLSRTDGFNGALDELTFYNRALSVREISNIYQAGNHGKCLPNGNTPPVVDAGQDRWVESVSQLANLQGYALDDNAIQTIHWSRLSGPGELTFGNADTLPTTVSADTEGVYILELTVSDGQYEASDTIELHVAKGCNIPILNGVTNWWSFNGHARDLIGGADGQWFGLPSYQEGYINQSFNGQDSKDVIEIKSSNGEVNPMGEIHEAPFSIEYWVKYDGTNGRVMEWKNNGSNDNYIDQSSTTARFGYQYILTENDYRSSVLTTSYDFTSQEWNHVSWTYDGSVLKGYINGVEKSAVTRRLSHFGFRGDLFIGGLLSRTDGFKGALDELTFYNRTLSVREISNIYQAGNHGKCLPNGNTPPVVDAGQDRWVESVTQSANLQGYTLDDNAIQSIHWSKVSGPGELTLGNSNALVTTVTANIEGVYILELTVSDGQYEASDTIEFHVATGCNSPLLSGATHWWSFNGHARDLIGGGDGQWFGTPNYQEGYVNQSFNGQDSTDVIEIKSSNGEVNPMEEIHETPFSIEYWVKYDGTNGRVMEWKDNGSNDNYIDQSSTTARFGYQYILTENDYRSSVLTTIYDFTSQEWNHVSWTYDGSVLKGYINGVEKSAATRRLSHFGFRGDLFIGGLLSRTDGFKGALDELTFYNRALSAREIQNVYQAGTHGKCLPNGNTPPVVDAGQDRWIQSVTKSANLQGFAVDDNSIQTTQWSKVSGPGELVFGDVNALSTTVTTTLEGLYVIELKVGDGQYEAMDTIELHVANGCNLPLLNGTTHWWSFNGHARDLIGDNDGYWFGLPSYQGGYIYQSFNGLDSKDVIEIKSSNGELNPMNGVNSTPFAIEFWIKYDGTNGRVLEWKDDGLRDNYIYIDTNSIDFNYNYNTTSYTSQRLSNDFSLGEWHHVTFSYDGSLLKGYIDGREVNSVTRSLNAEGFNGDLFIGGILSRTDGFKGALDELTFYNRALSLNDVLSIYQAGNHGKCLPNGNNPPVVDAGADRSIESINTLIDIIGSAADDTGIETVQWSKLSGPGEVAFTNSGSLSTTASADIAGFYLLELRVGDGQYEASDIIELRVATNCSSLASDGLTHWWSFNGHARDHVGSLHGEWLGIPSYQTGYVGSSFTGQDSKEIVEINPTTITPNVMGGISGNPFTFNFWLKYDGTVGRVLEWSSDGLRDNYLYVDSNSIDFVYNYNTTSFTSIVVANDFSMGQWHHVSYTYDGVILRAYIDGVESASATRALNPVGFDGKLVIGGLHTRTDGFKGALDELAFYNKALSEDEIQEIFNAGPNGRCLSTINGENNQAPQIASIPPLTLPQDVRILNLTASVLDDGLPTSGSLTYQWTSIAGPAPPAFNDTSILNPQITFPLAGEYTLQLEASDGELITIETVTITVTGSVFVNLPPSIDAGIDESISIGEKATVAFSVTDTTIPIGRDLSYSWSQVTGPNLATIIVNDELSQVEFSNLTNGRYIFSLSATDGELTVSDTVDVFVASTATGAIVSAGADVLIKNPATANLIGAVDPSRLPVSSTYEYQWYKLSGPSTNEVIAQEIGTLEAPNLELSNLLPGVYVFELQIIGDNFVESDQVSLFVEPVDVIVTNTAPLVTLPEDLDINNKQVTITAIASDMETTNDNLFYTWSVISTPGEQVPVLFSAPSAVETLVQFEQDGEYTIRLTVSDGELETSDDIVLTVRIPELQNQPPVVNAGEPIEQLQGTTINLIGSYTDPDSAIGDISIAWQQIDNGADVTGVASITDPTSLNTEVSLPSVGEYTFELTVSDGEFTVTDTVHVVNSGIIDVAINSPTVNSEFGIGGQILFLATTRHFNTELLFADFIVDGIVYSQAALEENGEGLSTVPNTLAEGEHTLVVRAYTEFGTFKDSEPVSFNIQEGGPQGLDIEITSPEETIEGPVVITQPTEFSGTVRSSNPLSFYELQYKEFSSDTWIATSRGTTEIENGNIGSFDPTLLENGTYSTRLYAEDTVGFTSTIEGPTVVVEGDMKIGRFTLAFEDLSVPLTGVPIQLTRYYDSAKAISNIKGDFGPGWDLGIKSMKVNKNRILGAGWQQFEQQYGFGLRYYSIESTSPKIVSVTLPDGEVEKFEASIRTPPAVRIFEPYFMPDLPENAQIATPITSAKLVFKPLDNAQGSLILDGYDDVIFKNDDGVITSGARPGTGFLILDGTADQLLFGEAGDRSKFVYYAEDGTRYTLDELDGLQRVEDRNDNVLTFTDDGIFHSSGEAIVYTRDAEERIIAVTDPAGEQITYAYDAEGRLSTVTNRVDEVTSFEYLNPNFPNYLTDILDPRGIRALRVDYDADGRMTSQTDAAGNSITFTHDLSNNRETVTDRLGNATIHEYDDRGNIIRTTDALGNVTLRSYDENENEISMTSPEGVTTEQSFDSSNNLLFSKDGLGNTTYYDYTTFNNPEKITDPLGRETNFDYLNNGNLSELTDASGATTAFTYSNNGDLSSLTDEHGTTTSYTHDSKGRELSMTVTAADGVTILRTESHTYDTNGNRLSSTTKRTLADGSEQSLTSTYEYDEENRLTRTTLPDGSTNQTVYNNFGKEEKTIDALGRETLYEYDSRGNLVKTTFPDTTTSLTYYDVEGRRTASTDREGKTMYYVYDALGRSTEMIYPDETMPTTTLVEVVDILADASLADNPRSQTIYDGDSRVVASIDALGNRTEFFYDAASRRYLTRDAEGNETIVEYDESSAQKSVTDALGRKRTFEYDSAGRLHKTVLPDGTFTTVAYDDLGRRTSVQDQMNKQTQFEYDDLGRLVAVIDAENNRTEYEYNEQGSLLTQRDALGRETLYEYDQLGRRVKRILPQGQVETNTYDILGRMTDRTDFRGYTTSYEFDIMNRVTAINADGTHPSLVHLHAPAKFEFSYDVLGRRDSATVKNVSGVEIYRDTWAFDDRGRLTTHGSTNGDLSYSYDNNNNLVEAESNTPSGFHQRYQYDVLNRIKDVHYGAQGANNTIHLSTYGYNEVGSMTEMSYRNRVGHMYQFDTLNRLTDLKIDKLTDQGTVESNQQHYKYTLNASGHRTQIQELHSGRTVNHTFDNLYRLTSENIFGGALNGTVNYSFDAVSNRTSRSSTVARVSNQTHTHTDNDWLAHHSYDDNGSTTTSPDLVNGAGDVHDIYDFRNKLIRRTSDNGDVIEFLYNADGHRVNKSIGSGGVLGIATEYRYLVDSNNPTGYSQVVEEKNTNGILTRSYHLGHQRFAMTDHTNGGDISYYNFDGHGSIRGLSNENGDVVEEYDFDSYGILIEFRKDTGSGMIDHDPSQLGGLSRNEFLFAGEQWDADMGMYYNRARYLDVENGRFNAMDDWQGKTASPITLNKYLYAGGNAVTYLDPSGNFSIAGVMSANAIATNLRSTHSRVLFSVGNTALNTIYGAYMGWSAKQIVANMIIGEVLGFVGGKVIAGVGSKVVSSVSSIPRFGTAAKSGFLCFVEGTQVKTKDGFKNIEDIEIGDMVWSKSDSNTGDHGYKEVVKLFVTKPKELIHLTYSRSEKRSRSSHMKDTGEEDSILSGTAEHPFWSLDRECWVPMGELEVGERLSLADGSVATVKSLEVEKAKAGESFTTYNFEVADWHTYYVAPKGETNIDNCVWVHNLGGMCAKGFGDAKALFKRGYSKDEVKAALSGFDFTSQLNLGGRAARDNLRKSLGLVRGSGLEAHHIIPWSLRKHPLVTKAARGGFDMNGLDNGIAMNFERHRGTNIYHHNKYNSAVENVLNSNSQRLGDISEQEAAAFLREYAHQLRVGIGGSTGKLK